MDRRGQDDEVRVHWSVPPGQAVLGKFRLIARLGRGGMGEALLAVAAGAQGFRKLVVVKRLHERLSNDAKMRALFLEEARLAARLSHANVVQTYEVGCEGSTLLMAMEYLEGQTLSRIGRLCPRPVSPRLVARMLSDGLAGLHYAHELDDFNGRPLGIVHRDVSPQNFIVTYGGVVKVLDFGVAKSARQSSVTEAGVLKGKLAYMSPEHFDGHVDRRADIFGVGIVLWELLCGRRLFGSDAMQKTVHALLNTQAEPPSTLVATVPRELDAIVLRALEKDPAKRYQTALEMREALERYLDSSGPPVRQEEIGAFVTNLFYDEREAVEERIRQMMAKDEMEDVEGDSLPLLVESTTGTSVPSHSAFGLIASAARVPRRRGRWLAVGVAAGVVCVTAMILGGRRATLTPIESAPAATVAVEPTATASTTPPPSAMASSALIEAVAAPEVARPVRAALRRTVGTSDSPTPSPVVTSTTSTTSAAQAVSAIPVAAPSTSSPESPAPSTPGRRKFRTEF